MTTMNNFIFVAIFMFMLIFVVGEFVSSVGFVQLDVVKEDVKKQSEHHNTIFIE